ncbi:MAG: hypothetical protein AAB958_02415 [Patescibacteria group bacterium]
MFNKPLLLLYEGISGSGKTSLSKTVQKELGYGVLSIDRFTPSIWVYSKYRGEEILELNRIAERNLELNFDVRVIWCECEISIANQRCLDKNQIEKSGIDKLTQQAFLFQDYFKNYSFFSKILQMDTSLEDIKETVKKVVNYLDE